MKSRTLLAGWDADDLRSIPSDLAPKSEQFAILPYSYSGISKNWLDCALRIRYFGDIQTLNNAIFTNTASDILSGILSSVIQFTEEIPAHVYSNLIIQYERISKDHPSHWLFDTFWRSIVGLMIEALMHSRPKSVIFRVFPHLFSDYCLFLAARFSGCNVYIIQPLRGLSSYIRSECADPKGFVYAQVYSLSPLKRINVSDYISASATLNREVSVDALLQHVSSIDADLIGLSNQTAYSEQPAMYDYKDNLHRTLQKNLNESIVHIHREDVISAIVYLATLKKNYLKMCSARPGSVSSPFILFPLHKQPEASTSPAGGIMWNHESSIRELSRFCCSNGIKLLVKEHPHMFSWSPVNSSHFLRSAKFSRDLEYYERIAKSSKSVAFAPLDQSLDDLLIHDNCLGSFSVEGTVGISTLLASKILICCGEPWYKSHHNVIAIKNLSDIRSLSMDQLCPRKDPQISNSMVRLIREVCDKYVVALRFDRSQECVDLYGLIRFLST